MQCSRIFIPFSLQNRRNFLRILGEWRRKEGEHEARATRKGRNTQKLPPVLQANTFRAFKNRRLKGRKPVRVKLRLQTGYKIVQAILRNIGPFCTDLATLSSV